MKNQTRKPAPPEKDILPVLRKCGQATRQTFITAIKRATDCTDNQAGMIFVDAVEKGDVVEAGEAGLWPGLKKYFAK